MNDSISHFINLFISLLCQLKIIRVVLQPNHNKYTWMVLSRQITAVQLNIRTLASQHLCMCVNFFNALCYWLGTCSLGCPWKMLFTVHVCTVRWITKILLSMCAHTGRSAYLPCARKSSNPTDSVNCFWPCTTSWLITVLIACIAWSIHYIG